MPLTTDDSLRAEPAHPHDHDRDHDVAALAQRHRATVWRYLRVLGADAVLADDLVQEAFLVVLRRPEFEARDPVAALHFLRATARHLLLRSQRRRVPVTAIEAGDVVWRDECGDGDGAPRLLALRCCVAELPPRSRELLSATYAEGLGRADAARRLRLSEDGVKSALRRLRAWLEDCVTRRLRQEDA